MNKSIAIVASLLSLSVGNAFAADASAFSDYARVKSVTPEYERVNTPRDECHSEYISSGSRRDSDRGDRSYGGAVIGGLAGGVIGNQVGKGHGREAATAAGAVIGALVGDRVDNGDNRYQRDDEPREVRRCRQVDDWSSRLTGYRVVYEYGGHRYTTVMPNDPGRQLRVRVSVEPE
ncbi:glycine zipper 2TM domain-containing protein [Chitinivorax sp. PXF-14]|uniref:glycine zipper 2TM domain-containing protein n=1 Tax=Chitinivorax sp. PXF-14 TaxID=3230488 RepID=UPI003467442D